MVDAYLCVRLPVPAREEAKQREHEYHDENDPENAHAVGRLPSSVPHICFRMNTTENRSLTLRGQAEALACSQVRLRIVTVPLPPVLSSETTLGACATTFCSASCTRTRRGATAH